MLTGKNGAKFNPERTHRFLLWRRITDVPDDQARWVAFIGCNPSTADEDKNDPTVTRCQRRAEAMGFDGFIMLNVFSIRGTDPKILRTAPEANLIHNDNYILWACKHAAMVVCCWGKIGEWDMRGCRVEDILRRAEVELHYLRLTKQGRPMHPLYLPNNLQPTKWTKGVAAHA